MTAAADVTISVVAGALEATAPQFEERRDFARKRQHLIAGHAELKERELIKLASLASAIMEGLRERGLARASCAHREEPRPAPAMTRAPLTLPTAVLLFALSTTSCGSSPTTPNSAVTLGGTYSGSTSDSTGSGTMTWTASQSGSSVSASVTATTAKSMIAFTGSLSGGLTGTALTFTITVPAGGISGFPICSATINGSAIVSSSTISGTYTGTNSCSGAFSNGQFTLAKQ